MIQLISYLVILQYLDDSFTLERATKHPSTHPIVNTSTTKATYSSFDLDGIVLGQLGVSIELVLVVVVVVIMMVVSVIVVAVVLAAMLVIAVVVVTLILVAIVVVVVVVRFAAGIG